MLGNSSVSTSLKLDRGTGPRTLLRELRLPSFLLLLVTAGIFAANVRISAAAIPTVPPETPETTSLPETVHATLSEPAEPAEPADEAAPVSFAALRTWGRQSPSGLSPKALAAALDAVSCARGRGVSGNSDVLTVIDYSLPSTQPRLWVLDV